MLFSTRLNPEPSQLPPLPAPDQALLARAIAVNENFPALSTETGIPLLDLYRWHSRPDIAAYIAAHREAVAHSRRERALAALESIVATTPDPIERRRAIITILRALNPQPTRPACPQSPRPAPPRPAPFDIARYSNVPVPRPHVPPPTPPTAPPPTPPPDPIPAIIPPPGLPDEPTDQAADTALDDPPSDPFDRSIDVDEVSPSDQLDPDHPAPDQLSKSHATEADPAALGTSPAQADPSKAEQAHSDSAQAAQAPPIPTPSTPAAHVASPALQPSSPDSS